MARRAAKPRSTAVHQGAGHPDELAGTLKAHLDLPAGYHVGGTNIATLREILDPSTPTMSLAELTEQQRVELAVARLQSRPDDFRMVMVGPGVIDKTRAIAEVKALTRVGRTLMEIEHSMLLTLTGSRSKPRER